MAELVKVSQGSPRQAVVILDQVIDIADDAELLEAIRRNMPLEFAIKELTNALLKNNWDEAAKIAKTYQEGTNWEQVRMEVLRYCGGVLLNTGGAQAAKIMTAFKEPVFNSGKAGIILACYNSVK
jgi:DNA polymerase III gamma/tau subunit